MNFLCISYVNVVIFFLIIFIIVLYIKSNLNSTFFCNSIDGPGAN